VIDLNLPFDIQRVGICMVITGKGVTMRIKGYPYDYPFDGDLRPANTALMLVDMQFDFCDEGAYVDKMGYDISLTRAAIKPLRKILAAARSWGCHILHTREGHRGDLSDLPPTASGGAGAFLSSER
jgi:biuret amidohydrolase